MNHSYKFKILSFQWREIKIRIAQIENPELLFDDLLKKNISEDDIIDERIPYWAELWPSSIALAEFISENSALVKNKRIIEIGCGLGLAGITAASVGANVMLTDYLQEAIDYAKYNWKLNFDTEANASLLDWRVPVKLKLFDVLLASDLAYESRSFVPLLSTMRSLIRKDGCIIISEPNRKFAKQFFDDLRNEGFVVTSEDRKVVKDGINYKITIYRLTFADGVLK